MNEHLYTRLLIDGVEVRPASTDLLHISMSREEAVELLTMLNRAVNTLEPKCWPAWIAGLIDRLESFSHAKT